MHHTIKQIYKSSALAVIVIGNLAAMNLTNLRFAYIRPTFHGDKRVQLDVLAEHGFRTRAYDDCGFCANPLRMWNKEQDALKMLEGFPDGSAIGLLNTRIGANDDGIRGHFLTHGKLDLDYNLNFAARWRFAQNFIIGAYLPVCSMRLHDVRWTDLTESVQDQDLRVKDLLTNNFTANVAELGGLFIGNWHRHGLGDLLLLTEWLADFPQQKPMLRNVHLNARLGMTLPSGLKQNEDLLLALPFGYDGSVGLIFAGGLDAFLGDYLQTGFDVELVHVFGNTRDRRIKVDPAQTSLLLLAKVPAYRDWGLTQRFNLYLQFNRILPGFSAKFDYQFVRHGEDALVLTTQQYSNNVANLDPRLEGWTTHEAIFNFTYDFAELMAPQARAKPYLTFFAKTPFNGKQSVIFSTVGAVVAVDF
ncbi:MAG TPA: hypothetical protein VLG71_01875 [Candidatus Limnocylindria bacterium]|nr:hypothetical protein [Candidatus Limnocylindria bacterium]